MSLKLSPCDHDECPTSHCKRSGSLDASAGSASYWRTPCACGFIAKSQEEWQRHGILYQGCKKKINAKRRSEPVNDQTQQLAAVPCSSSDVELAVCEDIANRQKVGIRKYGMTVANNPLSLREWLQHAYEECLDQAVYLKRAMSELPPLPKTCRKCGGDGSEEIQSGPYFRQCSACLGTGKENEELSN